MITATGAQLEWRRKRWRRGMVAGLMANYDAFLAPATAHIKNIAPRVAALLYMMQISDVLSVESANTFTRPISVGNAIHGAICRRHKGDHSEWNRLCLGRADRR